MRSRYATTVHGHDHVHDYIHVDVVVNVDVDIVGFSKQR